MKKGMRNMAWGIIMALILAACGTNTGTDTGTGTGTQTQTDSKAQTGTESSEVVTVNFWTAPQQVQYNFWEERANTFNATNPQINGKRIEVKVQQMPETPSSEAGIQNAIATGTAPAVSENINRGFARVLAVSEVVYDISQEAWFNEVVEARQIGEVMKGWAIDGKQYVLPVYVNPIAWQWNLKALKIMGIEKAPETIEEFNNVIKAFTEHKEELGKIGVTHTLYRPWLTRADQFWERWFDFLMVYNGISQGKSVIEGNKLTMDATAAKEALEVIGTFGSSIQQSELSNIWLEENPSILVSINAPWEIALYRENNKVYGEDFVYGPSLVKNAGDKPYNFGDSKGLTFYKASNITEEQHAGAVEFVKWVYNKDNSASTDLDWLKATTMLPVRGDLNTNEAFAEQMKEYPELADLAAMVPYSIPGLATDKDPDIWSAFTEAAMGPYTQMATTIEPGNAPDAAPFIEAAIPAMKAAGNLE